MTSDQRPPSIGTFTVSGGQVNVSGDSPSFVQYNFANSEAALGEVRSLLVEIDQRRLGEFRDPEAAGTQLRVIESELARPKAADRATVQGAVAQLTALAVTGAAVLDLLTRIQELVNVLWS